MKNRKTLTTLTALSLVAVLCVAAFAADPEAAPINAAPEAAAGKMANDAAASQSLFGALNTARGTAGLGAMTYDSGLEKVALAYAEELANAGSDFRKTTDYLTLPSGERVASLVNKTGYGAIQDFYYYVWQNPAPGGDGTAASKAAFVQATDLFATAAGGSYKNVGIAVATVSDGSYSAVIMMFCNPLNTPAATAPTTEAPAPDTSAPADPAPAASETTPAESTPAASSSTGS